MYLTHVYNIVGKSCVKCQIFENYDRGLLINGVDGYFIGSGELLASSPVDSQELDNLRFVGFYRGLIKRSGQQEEHQMSIIEREATHCTSFFDIAMVRQGYHTSTHTRILSSSPSMLRSNHTHLIPCQTASSHHRPSPYP